MRYIARAVELDPFNAVIRGMAGAAFLMARRPDEALAHYEAMLKLTPDARWGLVGTANAHHVAQRLEDALAAERRLADSDAALLDALTQGFEDGGYRGAMRSAADLAGARAREGRVPPEEVSRFFLLAGDGDRALDWLERASETHDPNLPYVASGHPFYDVVRDHQRFRALLQRMNLPPPG